MGSTPTEESSVSRSELLWRASRELNRKLDPDHVYRTLLELLPNAFTFHGLVVSSFDKERQESTCDFAWSGGKLIDPSILPPVPLGPEGTGMQSQVIRSGRGMIFDVHQQVRKGQKLVQVDKEGKPKQVNPDDPPATNTAMMVPMLLEDEVRGVVQLMSDEHDAFSEDDLEFFQRIVLLLTAAAQNAKLYQMAQTTARELEQKEAFLDTLLRTSPDVVYIFDLEEMREVYASDIQVRSLLGYTEAELHAMGSHLLSTVVHPDDLQATADRFSQWPDVSDGTVVRNELRVRHKDGSYRWFFTRETVYSRKADGLPSQILGFATDITERKQAEEEVRTGHEKLRAFMSAMPQIAWINGMDGASEYINGWYYQYTGQPPGTDPKQGWDSVVHPEDKPAAYEAHERARASGGTWEVEVRLRKADGTYRWHLSRQIPVRDGNGKVVRWLGTSTDIHSQKEAEAELERRVADRTAELQAALAELEGFTYSVSHDLRAPIRAIGSTSRLLELDFADQLSPEARELLRRQNEAARKMSTLVDELLRMARLSREDMMKSSFDLSQVAHEVADELREDGRAGDLKFDIQSDLRAHGDPRLMKLVLFNLVENAAKFSPAGGCISIGCEDGTFFVRDEGIGFEQQYAHKLFLPFERLVRDDEFPGTGIGLTNVQRIIQRHGGQVWADSELGKGATFYFTLPA